MRPYVVAWLAGHMGLRLAELLAPSWFTCVGLAGLVSLLVIAMRARRHQIETSSVVAIALSGYVAAVAAGIVVPMMIDAAIHAAVTGRVRVRWSGMTSFWGYLAGAAAVAWACRRERVSLARFGDLAVIPLGIALAIARLGCFMAGCDYGKASSLPWAVRFPAGSPAWLDHVRAGLVPIDSPVSLAVHPTELYEALLGVAIVAIPCIARRARRYGDLVLAAAATYAVGRFAIELVRGDAERGVYHGVSSGQIFCLCLLGAIVASCIVRRRCRLGA